VGTIAQFFAVIVVVLAAGVGAFASSTYNEGAIPVDFQVRLPFVHALQLICHLLATMARSEDGVVEKRWNHSLMPITASLSRRFKRPTHGGDGDTNLSLICELSGAIVSRVTLPRFRHGAQTRALTIAHTTLYAGGVASTAAEARAPLPQRGCCVEQLRTAAVIKVGPASVQPQRRAVASALRASPAHGLRPWGMSGRRSA
jgi:hypothetical protein